MMNPLQEVFARRGLPVASVPFSAVSRKPVEGAKTVLITALPYYFPPQPGQNLARFAALPDYHRYFGGILQEICDELQEYHPRNFFRAFTDNSPIDEQKAALESGLAVRGRNNLCITEKGSFVFLGEVITDFPADLSAVPPKSLCETCGKCIKACPNGALTEEGFHSEKCLAGITQKKGELTAEEAEALKRNGFAWGCDRCAEACPHNKKLPTAQISLPPNAILPRLTRKEIEGMTDRQYRERYSDRAFAWRGKATMLRNLTLLEEDNDGNEKTKEQ